MQERVAALVFSVRAHAYGLLQDGGATLLPWLQRYTPASPVPGTPPWLLGLLSAHGTVQPIVDLGLFLGYGASARDGSARLVFIERDEMCAGLLVDSAGGVRYLDRLERAEESAAGSASSLMLATATLGGERVRVLDGGRLIDALSSALDALGRSS